ncbi:MAG: YdeI/OmpD-associated family protein [Chitinophagaceae bacterium]
MVEFTTTILQFEDKGEKSGWSYIEIPVDISQQLIPGNKKSFKVKGRLDLHKFEGVNLLPMGGGIFIMALNTTVRKAIHKGKGAMLRVQLQVDTKPFKIPDWMIECLEDEPIAKARFYKIPKSHQNYYIKWIESAKTEPTRIKRIAQVVTSFVNGLNFGEMMRMKRED